MSKNSHDRISLSSHSHTLRRRLRRNRTLGAAIGFFLAAALMPAVSAVASVTVSGTIIAKITVNFVTAPPAGSTVLCSVGLISNDALAPNDSKSVSAAVTGSSAVCSFFMDYKWTVASATSTMTIAYSAAGPTQSSSAIYAVKTVPPNGTKTSVTVAVTQ